MSLTLIRDNEFVGFEAIRSSEDEVERLGMVRTMGSIRSAPYITERLRAEQKLDLERSRSIPTVPQKTLDGIVLCQVVYNG